MVQASACAFITEHQLFLNQIYTSINLSKTKAVTLTFKSSPKGLPGTQDKLVVAITIKITVYTALLTRRFHIILQSYYHYSIIQF